MANITISSLSYNGTELFQDSESFLDHLNDQEIGNIKGGVVILFQTTIVISGRRCEGKF